MTEARGKTPTSPLRILQVVTRRQLRGAEVFAGQLCTRLAAEGWDITLAGLYPPGDPLLEVPGVPAVDLFPRIARGISPRLVLRLAWEIRRLEPDLVQANGSDTLKYSVLARWLSGRRPQLVYRNISLASRWVRTPMHRWWNRCLLHSVDRVVAVSERSREDLRATYGLPSERITVIPRGVETEVAQPQRNAREALARRTGCDSNAPLIVHVGSFTREKNHRGMLEVLCSLHRRHPRAQLVCFGDGPLREEIRREVRRLGLEQRVLLPGARPDAADLAAGADLLLLFSFVEGLPGVVLEAGARAVPVVVSDVGGVREVVTDGESGRLVAPGDIAGCARAIGELLDNDALRRRLGETLRTNVRARYDLNVNAARFRELYTTLLTASSDKDPTTDKPSGSVPTAPGR